MAHNCPPGKVRTRSHRPKPIRGAGSGQPACHAAGLCQSDPGGSGKARVSGVPRRDQRVLMVGKVALGVREFHAVRGTLEVEIQRRACVGNPQEQGSFFRPGVAPAMRRRDCCQLKQPVLYVCSIILAIGALCHLCHLCKLFRRIVSLWTDHMLRVHAFSCVLALTLVSLLHRRVDQAGVEITQSRLMEQLKGIKEITNYYPAQSGEKLRQGGRPRSERTLTRLDPQQEQIFRTLQLGRFLAG